MYQLSQIAFTYTSRVLVVVFINLGAQSNASELYGYVSLESRQFTQSALLDEQNDSDYSLSGELEYFTAWSDQRQSLLFKPFFRIDNNDKERSHIDIHEFIWSYMNDNFNFKVGIGKEYWGATEFYHLVDVINQTDAVESIDGESKLGQPMLSMSFMDKWGEVELFLLPGFRERTFPGDEGRLQLVPNLDTDDPVYESGKEDRHVDWAFRWSHTIKNIDLGVGYFNGTSRDPLFIANNSSGKNTRIVPFYSQIEQVSLDAQSIFGNTLFKLESLYRSGQGKSFVAATGGIEYSFVGINDSQADLGLVLEYMYDERGNQANHFQQDDIGVGVRFVLNDTQSSELLVGVIIDKESQAKVWSLESSRRLGDNWKLNIEGYLFQDIDENDILRGIKNDDYLSMEIIRYF